MGKYTKKIIARLMAAMLIIATMTISILPPQVVCAAEKYFADVDKDNSFIEEIDFCNRRGAFGKKRGPEFYFHPDDIINKGKFIDYVYNMYHKPMGWGDKDYSSKAKKSWRWAQSHGIIKRSAKSSDVATYGWEAYVLDRLTYAINGGYHHDDMMKQGGSLPLNNRTAISTLGYYARGYHDPADLDIE